MREFILNERRFTTAIEAAARGVMTIGEEEPILPDGTCEELSFTTGDGKTCHFTGRNDIFRHLLLTGGWHGSKETVKQLTTRVFSFINYYMDKVNEPKIKALFETDEYKQKIGNICRDGWAAQVCVLSF